MENVNPYQAPEASTALLKPQLEPDEPVRTFRSARPWGIAACLGIWLQVMLAIAAIVLSFVLLSLYRVNDVDEIDPVVEQWLLSSINIAFVSMVVLRLGTAVLFWVWVYRAYVNLLALGHRSLDWKPFMSVVCWLIPILNFIGPCLVMRELRWRSDPRAEELGKANAALQTVNLWWAGWIAGIVLGWVGNRLDFGADTLADHVLATRCDIATMVVLTVCGLLAIWIIWSIDSLQLRRFAAHSLNAPAELEVRAAFQS